MVTVRAEASLSASRGPTASSAEPRPVPAAPQRGSTRERAALALVLVVAAALRLYHLDSQLWLDEISAVRNSIRRPLLDILTQWSGPSSHALFEFWARASTLAFGETPFAVRLPAALAGIAGVAMLYALVADLLDRRHALAITALLALSYHHVFYSQDARGYTTLILFYLVTTRLVVRFYDSGRVSARDGVLYAAAATLAGYSHLIGVFILPAQVAVMAGAWLASRRRGRTQRVPLAAFLGAAVLATALTAALYAPFVGRILASTQANAAAPAEGPRLGAGLLLEIVEGLSAAFRGPVGLAAAVLVGITGVVAWYRRHPFALAALTVPVAVQGVALVALGVGIHPRYLAIALVAGIVIGGYGIVTLIARVVEWLPAPAARQRTVEAAALAAVALLSTLPLYRYYSVPKQDFLGAIAAVNRVAAAGDARVGVQLTGRVLNGYYDAGFIEIETLDDLLAVEQRDGRVWLVTTLERLLGIEDPALLAHIRGRYRRFALLPGTIGDGAMRIYEYPARARD